MDVTKVARGILFLVPALFALVSASADAFTMSPYVQAYYMSGDAGYEIKGTEKGAAPGPFDSKLRFNFDNMGIEGGSFFHVSDRVQLRFSGWSTLFRDVGSMSDRDWLESGSITVSSNSDQQMHAWGVRGEFRYWVIKGETFSLAPSSQVLYDYYFFRALNTDQRSSDPNFNTGKMYGLASTYEQQNVSWLVGVVLKWNPASWFQVEWTGSYSPVTYVWDRDNHVLRSKLSTGKGVAYAFQTALHPDFILWKRVSIGPWASYFYMGDYWGEQDQSWYSGPKEGQKNTGISDNITRQHWAAGGRIVVGLDIGSSTPSD